MTNNIQNADVATIKKDRMRFKTNNLSSSLALLAVVINVLYFVCIYKSDVNQYYYTFNISLSILYNLVFMLAAFLSSIGVKNYKLKFAVILIVLGAFQIVRIFGIPLNAFNEKIVVDGAETRVMQEYQFVRTIVYLVSSSALLIASGVIGIVRTKILINYKRQIGDEQPA